MSYTYYEMPNDTRSPSWWWLYALNRWYLEIWRWLYRIEWRNTCTCDDKAL